MNIQSEFFYLIFSVGGGSLFSSASQSPVQAIAAALVPAGVGLTPVAFFPQTAAQTLPAISVIFAEAALAGRKKRDARNFSFGKRERGDVLKIA